jgi:hypothetical protein
MIRNVSIHLFVLSLLAAPIVARMSSAYDRATETSLAGTVAGVDAYAAADGTVAVHLEVNTGRDIVRVHVGPATYIGQQNFSFLNDDRVSIIGARVSQDGNSAVWARAIMKGSAMLVLRNEDGTPKWTPAVDGTDGCGVEHPPLPRMTER